MPRRYSKPVVVKQAPKPAFSKKQARAVQSLARKTLNQEAEWKHHDAAFGSTAGYAGAILDLSVIAQGDTDTARDGDVIQASSCQVRYEVYNADNPYNVCRMIVFQWYGPASPVAGDILLNLSTVQTPMLMYNTDKAPLYKIMYDKTVTPRSVDNSGTAQSGVAVKNTGKLRVPRRKIQYSAGGTTGVGKIWALIVSDSSVATHPTWNGTSRINFKDM